MALIGISYPHNYTKLDKSYTYLLLNIKNDEEEYNFQPDNTKDQRDLYDVMNTYNQRGDFTERWEVIHGADIPFGNYEISKILELIKTQFNMVLSNKTINLKINQYQYRVEINPNETFMITCYADHSILKLLGFGSQSATFEFPQERTVE